MGSAREAAMLTLTACDKQGAWSEGHLKRILKESALDRRDAALATRLCFGVLQTRMTLDWYLERRCTGGLKKLEPKVLSILRLSLYQILYMDKIPPSAAVNEGVQLTKKHCRNPRAAGMVNGVLRGILRDMPLPPPQGKDELETIALQTSHPRWLVEEFAQVLGVDGEKASAQADHCQPPPTAPVHTAVCTVDQAVEELERDGVEVQRHPWLEGCLLLSSTGDMERLCAYQKGYFYIQDAAARLAVTAAHVQPGQRVLDCCAAPGGKSSLASTLLPKGSLLVANEVIRQRSQILAENLTKWGCPNTIVTNSDPADFGQLDNFFDVLLTDVPCSGEGMFRKDPVAVSEWSPQNVELCYQRQRRILSDVWPSLKPGGIAIYSIYQIRLDIR